MEERAGGEESSACKGETAQGEEMTRFDWVTARAECSIAAIFEQLKLQLQQDVDTRQALSRGSHAFRLILSGDMASVVLETREGWHQSVIFRLRESAIEV